MSTTPPLTHLPAPALLLGPAYSGKSELAMQLLRPDQPATVIGTAARDKAFAPRIERLKALRPGAWETVDCGTDLPAAVADALAKSGQVLVDSVSQWLAGVVVAHEALPEAELDALIATHVEELLGALSGATGKRVVLVSAEVGAGPAPSRAFERLYRQAVGRANQRLAAASASVLLVTAGLHQRLK